MILCFAEPVLAMQNPCQFCVLISRWCWPTAHGWCSPGALHQQLSDVSLGRPDPNGSSVQPQNRSPVLPARWSVCPWAQGTARTSDYSQKWHLLEHKVGQTCFEIWKNKTSFMKGRCVHRGTCEDLKVHRWIFPLWVPSWSGTQRTVTSVIPVSPHPSIPTADCPSASYWSLFFNYWMWPYNKHYNYAVIVNEKLKSSVYSGVFTWAFFFIFSYNLQIEVSG